MAGTEQHLNIGASNPVFGEAFVESKNETLQCTTAKLLWTNQISVLTPSLVSNAEYRYGLYLEHSQDVASKSMDVRITLDGLLIEDYTISTDDNVLTRFESFHVFHYAPAVSSGQQILEVDFKLTNLPGNFEACIKNSHIEFWRVQ